MELLYPRLGQSWQNTLRARRYGFLLCDNPISVQYKGNFFILTYVLQGEMDHIYLGKSTHFKKGDYFFLDMNTERSHFGTPDLVILHFMFYPEVLDSSQRNQKSLSQIANSPIFRFNTERLPLLNRHKLHDHDGRILHLLEQIQLEIQEKKPGHHQMEQALIQQLVINLMRMDYTAQTEAHNNPLAQQLLQELDAKYAGMITLKSIADKLGYSAEHLSREFKRIFGTSFTEYLQKLRLAKSCKLLLETDWPIAQIAAAVGYDNVQFYHRIFKKYYQLTPLQYRKKKNVRQSQ